MKKKIYILGLLAALCLLGTGYYAWTLYDAHCKQVVEWNEGAKAAFEEALWMEVNKRADIPIPYYSSETKGLKTLNESNSDTIYVTSSFGRRGYYIDPVRNERSLVKDADKRVMLGVLLDEYPLSVDTLAKNWNDSLSNRKIPAQSLVRYIYTDLDLHNDTAYSVLERRLDSLTVNYLGFRCEHELTAFVSYPHWLYDSTYGDGCILLFPWFLFVLLFVCYPKLETLVKRKLIHKEVIEKTIEIEKTVEVEKTVIVEKEIHIADVTMDKTNILRLPDGTLLDSFSGSLKKDGLQQRLQPQSVSLLKLLLGKDDRRATSDEICMKLWGDAKYSYRLHSAITRLRNDLKAVKSELIVSCSYGVYELKSPISSNISNQN